MKKLLLASLVCAISISHNAIARTQINITGSSTIYPFATVVAENFGLSGNFKTPKIESTGSGGGLKLFCEGIGINTPDITSSSRRIKQSEIDRCRKNGVNEVIEVKIGYDGIVMAQSKNADTMRISLKQIYLALTKDVPDPDGSESFVPNPYIRWSDIDPKFPDIKIEVLGPPPTSGTRDAFAEMALEGGCRNFAWIKAMKKTDKKAYKVRCHSVREDGAYVEAGENDNLIVQKLNINRDALGILGFSFLDQNKNIIRGIEIENVTPSFENITNGNYPLSRPLYFYVKKAHVGIISGIMEYIHEFISEKATGDEGYLVDKSLIPLLPAEKQTMLKALKNRDVLPASL